MVDEKANESNLQGEPAEQPASAVEANRPEPESPGKLIEAARIKAGLTRADMARELNLAEAKLEAVENDEYDKLPSDVFAQGYLRRCAKLLRVDEQRVVAIFYEWRRYHRESQPDPDRELRPSPSLPRWLLPAGIFAVAVVILILVFINMSGGGSSGPVTEAPQERIGAEPASQATDSGSEADETFDSQLPVAEAVEAPEAVTESPVIDSDRDAPAEAESDPGSVALPEETAPQAVVPREPAPEAAPQQPAASAEDVLAFTFSDDCWVEVKDANGSVIYANVARGGESLNLEGQGPFSVMLGNARAASLTYNGEFFVVPVRGGARTSRFEVGE